MVTSLPGASAARHVAISGASGLIGRALSAALRADGCVVHPLRRGRSAPAGAVAWDPPAGLVDAQALDGMDAVINLAGEPIDHRWTAERKRRIRESRIGGTTLLARTLAGLAHPPRVLLSASAVGIYGDRGDELLDESSAPGKDWLARTVAEWEAATQPAADVGTRVVLLRTGIALSADGGALARILPVFRAGLGGPLGSGRQWMSWIALVDIVRALSYLLDETRIAGAVNLCAPNAVRNEEFADVLGRVLRRPALVPVPTLALDLLFGEMARGTILASQRVEPAVLRSAGFEFRFETLEAALRDALAR